ncbi:YceD family protein [Peptostreptococcus faecalis]|uniref:YceD family protein n=1 Tax=Peptostreptococcus faecalis TaxID=2045015 RepID=UPI000C7C9815|nr:DUF177 domain-containing protein [Peptostreptococcus faecalis]
MELNIDSLYNNKDLSYIDFDLSENIEKINFSGIDYILVSPLRLNGKISKAGRNYLLQADVSFRFLTECGRCLKDVETPVDYKIDAYLMREEYDEDEYEDIDVFDVASTKIELLDIVNSTLIYNMPQKVLCSEDCKGICYECGVDLNNESCKCSDSADYDDIDPRFAKLKELLK